MLDCQTGLPLAHEPTGGNRWRGGDWRRQTVMDRPYRQDGMDRQIAGLWIAGNLPAVGISATGDGDQYNFFTVSYAFSRSEILSYIKFPNENFRFKSLAISFTFSAYFLLFASFR